MLSKNLCLDEDDLTAYVSWFLFYRVPLYYRIIKPVFCLSESTYYRLTDKILSILQSKKVYFKEYFTTPVPNDESKYLYNTSEGILKDCANNRELPYLHFLFFKKTPYRSTEDYWKGDYYHLDNSLIKEDQCIEINKTGIFFSEQM